VVTAELFGVTALMEYPNRVDEERLGKGGRCEGGEARPAAADLEEDKAEEKREETRADLL